MASFTAGHGNLESTPYIDFKMCLSVIWEAEAIFFASFYLAFLCWQAQKWDVGFFCSNIRVPIQWFCGCQETVAIGAAIASCFCFITGLQMFHWQPLIFVRHLIPIIKSLST